MMWQVAGGIIIAALVLSIAYLGFVRFKTNRMHLSINRREPSELGRQKSMLHALSQALGEGGALLMVRVGSRLRRNIRDTFDREMEDDRDLDRLESELDDMSIERLSNLSEKWERASLECDDEDSETSMVLSLLSGWLGIKAIVRRSADKTILEEARDLEDLCPLHIRNLLKIVRGEPLPNLSSS